MNTKIYVFLFKKILFLVNYHECYFVFIEFEYYIKLFVWMMKTMMGWVGYPIFFCIYLIIACKGPCPNIALKIALLERYKSLMYL